MCGWVVVVMCVYVCGVGGGEPWCLMYVREGCTLLTGPCVPSPGRMRAAWLFVQHLHHDYPERYVHVEGDLGLVDHFSSRNTWHGIMNSLAAPPAVRDWSEECDVVAAGIVPLTHGGKFIKRWVRQIGHREGIFQWGRADTFMLMPNAFAEKLMAQPGDRTYNPLAVLASVVSECRVCATFDRQQFDPCLPAKYAAAQVRGMYTCMLSACCMQVPLPRLLLGSSCHTCLHHTTPHRCAHRPPLL